MKFKSNFFGIGEMQSRIETWHAKAVTCSLISCAPKIVNSPEDLAIATFQNSGELRLPGVECNLWSPMICSTCPHQFIRTWWAYLRLVQSPYFSVFWITSFRFSLMSIASIYFGPVDWQLIVFIQLVSLCSEQAVSHVNTHIASISYSKEVSETNLSDHSLQRTEKSIFPFWPIDG